MLIWDASLTGSRIVSSRCCSNIWRATFQKILINRYATRPLITTSTSEGYFNIRLPSSAFTVSIWTISASLLMTIVHLDFRRADAFIRRCVATSILGCRLILIQFGQKDLRFQLSTRSRVFAMFKLRIESLIW